MIFVEVPNHPDYRVSPEGQILSLKGRKPRILAQQLRRDGYKGCHFSNGSERKRVSIHQLVARVFCHKPSENHSQVNHKDLNPQNNHYSNLEWVTPKQNIEHAISNGAKVGRPRRNDL